MEQRGVLAGKRILIVEDNYLVAEDLCHIVQGAAGHTVLATTAGDALTTLANGTFDGAFLDVGLKAGTSVEVSRALQRAHIPFVIVTGYGRDRLALELRDAPYLAKPFGREELISLATRYFVQATRAA